jgi:pilus assembly protein Flp/PilA
MRVQFLIFASFISKHLFERSIMFIYEKGQGIVEYALIVTLIAIVVILAMNFLGPTIGNVFSEIGKTMTTAT